MAARALPNPGSGESSILSFTAEKFNTVLGPETWKYALFDDNPIMSAAFDWVGGLGTMMWEAMVGEGEPVSEETTAIRELKEDKFEGTAAISRKTENLKDILQEQLLVQDDILREIVGDGRRFKEIEEKRERKRGLLFDRTSRQGPEPTTGDEDEDGGGFLSNLMNALGFRLGIGRLGMLATGVGIAGILGLIGVAIYGAISDMLLGALRSEEWGTSELSSQFGSLLGGQMPIDAAEWVKTLNMGVNAAKWAAIGAALGIPGGPIGMVAGGLIGAAIGAFLGSFGGEYFAKKLDAIGNTLSEFANAIGDWFGEVNDDIVNTVRSWGWTNFGETMDEGEQITTETKKQWGTEYGAGAIITGEQAQLRDFNEETFGVSSLWDTKTPEGREGMSSFLREKHPEEKELYTPQMLKLKINDPEKYNTEREEIIERNEGKVATQERERQIDYYTQMAPKVAQIEEQSGQPGLLKDYFDALDPSLQQELKLMGLAPIAQAASSKGLPEMLAATSPEMGIIMAAMPGAGGQQTSGSSPVNPVSGIGGRPKEVREAGRTAMAMEAIYGYPDGMFGRKDSLYLGK